MDNKKISKEEYMGEFCLDRRIRDRAAIYVSQRVHDRLKRVVRIFYTDHITVSSLADQIIDHHISTHADLLNKLEKEDSREFLEWLHDDKKPSER